MREEKATVIRQTVSPVMAKRHITKRQNELPQPISVPIANIVALAYGRANDEFDEDFPSDESIVLNKLANDDWYTDWPQTILSLVYNADGAIRVLFENASLALPKEDIKQPVQPLEKTRCGTPYQVQQGQTLEEISQEIYGTSEKWRQLYYVNRHMIGGSPMYLVVGQILKVPCEDVRTPVVRKIRVKKKRALKVRKKRRRVRTYVSVKKSHGNRLITITKVH